MVANLGTHTFYMIILPILFWCGYTSLGRGMVHILSSGVFFSGVLKDFFCLPRPLSPPLQRITMSGSAALEYGFPSTHSTNAVSVVGYSLYIINFGKDMPTTGDRVLSCILYVYAISIVLGRLYCGMHGFFDVIVGSLLGSLIAYVQCAFGNHFDSYIHSNSIKEVATAIFIILVLIRLHPEPADDCPCFDDSLAFAGVFMGIQYGNWHYGKSGRGWDEPAAATVPFNLERLGFVKSVLRLVLGVAMIIGWRGFMKPLLLRSLPPVFRVVGKMGLLLPRKFFLSASQYTIVPKTLRDDNIIPAVREIPTFFSNLRTRRRAVSIGPQSEADAYETMAYRERRRRASMSQGISTNSPPISPKLKANNREVNGVRSNRERSTPLGPAQSNIEKFESMMGTGFENNGPKRTRTATSSGNIISDDSRKDEEMFSRLLRPRVRYDVEVITKLIVYSGKSQTHESSSSLGSGRADCISGIAWIAVEGGPIVFDTVGLGL